MNRTLLLAFLCPLLATFSSVSANPAPQAVPMPGGYQPADVESAMVQEARAAAQKQLPNLRIETVLEAYVQVVAGANYRLVCRVSGEDGPSTWEFVVWSRLDGQWQLTDARRM